MLKKIAEITVFSIVMLMIIPAYADVDKVELDKIQFAIDEKFTISGTVSDPDRVMLTAVMKGPNGEKVIKNQRTDIDGTFSFLPVTSDLLFRSNGTYTITVFTENEKFKDAEVIKIEYNKGIAILLPDYDLVLKKIGNKTVDETEKLSFTASVTDSTIEELKYSLENYPVGATIDKETGLFSWTPTNTQSGGYIMDIIVKSGPLETRETITITVSDKPEPVQTAPEPVQTAPELKELEILAAFVEPNSDPQSYVDRYNNEATYKEWFDKNYSQYSSIYEAVGLEEPKGLAAFVEPNSDPQSYVDRYNNEATYKEWFDKNYSQYSSIYEAVGLEEPKGLAAFVEPNSDPQSYVDRYNNEATYKEWFDKNYSQYSSIYEAVGLEEPKEVKEKEFGTCGEGTRLVDGVCTIGGKSEVKPWWQFW